MGRKAIAVDVEKMPVVKTEVIIKIYEPENDLVITHKPEVIFCGELISMKMCDTINFHLRKALRRYKINLNSAKLNNEGSSEDGRE